MSAAAASVIGLAAAPALAATTTWTVKPGGAVTAKAKTVTVTDATAGQSLTCTSSTAAGTLKKGSKLSGKGIGTLTSLSFNSCSVLGVNLSVTFTGKMPLNAVSFNKSKNTASMTLTGIHGTINISSLKCTAAINGTSATANNGTVTATFSNAKDTLTVLTTGSNLHLYKVASACPIIKNNDQLNFTTSYKFTPGTTFTSP